jgi:protein subunit release factor A
MMIDPKDIHTRVIDQRIGMGISGIDTVMRLIHIPTGILVEVPRVSSNQHYDREIAMQMIESAFAHPKIINNKEGSHD